MLMELFDLIAVDPKLVRLLDELRRSYKLAVVTNGGASRQRHKLARLGVAHQFDAVIVSAEQGVQKPHRDMFTFAASALSVKLAEMVFVGDHPQRDIAPAQRLGMAGFWVSRGREWPLSSLPDRVATDVHGFWQSTC